MYELRKASLVKEKVAQSCPSLCDPMDYSVHAILQARILECVAFLLSRGFSQPIDRTQVSHIVGRFFTSWATGKPKNTEVGSLSLLQRIFWPGSEPGSPASQADSVPTELSGKQLKELVKDLVNTSFLNIFISQLKKRGPWKLSYSSHLKTMP